MALWGRGNLHSTLVAWAKVLLPLVALAVLSTLFVVSPGSSPEDTIPYAESQAMLGGTQRLAGATFAGMTRDGAALTLKAEEATPGVPGTDTAGAARGVNGLIETPDGVTTAITGASATLNQEDNTITLAGGVTMLSSAGLTMQTEALTVTLDRTRLQSRGKVAGQAPFGTIEAGELLMTRIADGTYVLDFTGAVQLIYERATAGTAAP